MSVVYEVNLEIDADTADAFRKWLCEGHIQEMLELDGFQSARLDSCELLGKETDKVLLRVQYTVASREQLESYFNEGAKKMRSSGIQLFEGKFTAWRRVLEPQQQF
ncbi:MAG: hypothetical protein MHM6MM_000387 [Cercozoa sp. M6MM]